MRISLSLLSALGISVMLLAIMANLVKQDTIGPGHTAPAIIWQVDTPTTVRETKASPRQLPKLPDTPALPAGPTILFEPRDDATPTLTLPPRSIDGGGRDHWPIGPVWPGTDPRTADEPTDTGNNALQPLQQIQPLYPRQLAAQGIEGWISLRFEVRQDGTVGNVQILAGSPRGAFDQAARQAVQRWRYQPIEHGPVVQTVRLDFTLEQ